MVQYRVLRATILSMSTWQDLPNTFTTGTARARGVHPRDLYAWRDREQIHDLSRGVFRRTDAPPASYPDLLAVAYRAPRAIVCCVSAAVVHDLTDELPRAVQRSSTPAVPQPMLTRWPVTWPETRQRCCLESPRSRRSPATNGVDFRTETITARTIRDKALYAGLRVTMDTRIATATVRFRLDVNFGDPITPAPRHYDLPALRPDDASTRVLGYPIETVLAEKISTAITLGDANTRVRDYADIYTLTGHQGEPVRGVGGTSWVGRRWACPSARSS